MSRRKLKLVLDAEYIQVKLSLEMWKHIFEINSLRLARTSVSRLELKPGQFKRDNHFSINRS